MGTAAAAQAEPLRFYGAGPQSYAGTPGAVAYAPTIQYVPVWYGADRRGDFGLLAGYGAARFAPAESGEGAQPRSDAHFFGDVPSEGPIPGASRGDDGLAPGLPALFTGVPTVPRYGEVPSVLGGRLGRLIGNHARWSMDAWALIRKDPAKAPPLGTLPATYGASQAGSVLRYQLAMQNPRQPTAYLRTTTTLGGITETSAALGLSARPLPSLPIIAAVEGRITEQGGSHRIQPAIMAVTAMPPLSLPGSLRAEMYGQGGYVGGRYATPFADGQVRVDRALVNFGQAQARVGAGAWGGIQKGASRLDAGPGATLSLPLSPKVFGRLAVDWRFRVAGNAEPDSGPALTVAAGF
jgi:hypothetical protein